MAFSTKFLNIYYNRASLQLMSLVVCKPYVHLIYLHKHRTAFLTGAGHTANAAQRVRSQEGVSRRRGRPSTCLAHSGCSHVGVAFFQEQDQIFDQAVLSAVCHSHNLKSLTGKDRRQIRAPWGPAHFSSSPEARAPGCCVRQHGGFSKSEREVTSMMFLESRLETGGMPVPEPSNGLQGLSVHRSGGQLQRFKKSQ